ncbi:hypothetical protein PCC6912_08000 [Chlorogloeopsis fritschii PCC 6912]|uniref:Uncharacterized protein n=1 Tax=Chlorogloeopsis fritschii PCC 6912 TaxID=211165 RepID=A0A3S0ZXC8_CHLFR|nr:hypothetical protein PCC6912_08000 [Chlorogloeopsis fritschii PCC 6912]
MLKCCHITHYQAINCPEVFIIIPLDSTTVSTCVKFIWGFIFKLYTVTIFTTLEVNIAMRQDRIFEQYYLS